MKKIFFSFFIVFKGLSFGEKKKYKKQRTQALRIMCLLLIWNVEIMNMILGVLITKLFCR